MGSSHGCRGRIIIQPQADCALDRFHANLVGEGLALALAYEGSSRLGGWPPKMAALCLIACGLAMKLSFQLALRIMIPGSHQEECRVS